MVSGAALDKAITVEQQVIVKKLPAHWFFSWERWEESLKTIERGCSEVQSRQGTVK